MIRTAIVSHSRDGYLLHVEDVPAWAYFGEWAESTLCSLSHGYLCAVCIPAHWGWLFRLGWGDDGDGYKTHSLGGGIFHTGQVTGRFWWRRHREVYKCPLPFDDACKHFPDSRLDFDDDGEDYVRGVMVR